MKHILGFSGGADSQAVAIWLRKQFPPEDVILVNADPGGNEHPFTTQFVEDYSRKHHPVVIVKPMVQDMAGLESAKIARMGLNPEDELTFDLLAQIKGVFPSSHKQFCTSHLKLYPIRRWTWENGAKGINPLIRRKHGEMVRLYNRPDMDENGDVQGILSDGFERYVGVRRDESDRRRDVLDREYDDFFGCWLNRPIAAWSKHQVFDYIYANGEEPNPLYKMGFKRVGCMLCVNAGKEEIRECAARFPEMIDKIRAWEQRVGRTFFTQILPGRTYGDIDKVVDWSKTVHGGKQYALPIVEAEADGGLCSSQWGLCE